MSTHKIWRDGTFVDWQDATIHVMSHVVHYGSSVFEGIRCYSTPDGPAIFRLQDHMRRFLDSCRIYRMPMQHSLTDLMAACSDVVSENDLDACYIRNNVAARGHQVGERVLHRHPVDAAGIEKPAHMILQPEDRRAVGGAVATDSLEDR